MKVDSLVTNIHQLVTPRGSDMALHGRAMNQVLNLPDAAMAIQDGRIVAVASRSQIETEVEAATWIDAGGLCVIPGFVDPHTHALWAGQRAGEFEQRIAGATYMEIMAAGGGILATVRATRAADRDRLMAETWPRLDAMLAHGTTTAEIKTGYGLTLEDERKSLDAIAVLHEQHALDLVPTFMGAHAIPPEYGEKPDAYVDLIVEEMLPDLAYMVYEITPESGRPYQQRAVRFCDVFCERGVFDVQQTRRILEAARRHGLGLKVHVDEFEPMGGTSLALELGATSVDHLVRTGEDELQRLATSQTVGVLLPGTPFGLGQSHFAPARQLIDLGGAVALASDLNPGTSWCESMPMMMALASRYMRLTPAECLTAATINAAHAIALGHHIGALAPGYQADFLILDSTDYRDLTYRYGSNLIKSVFKRGEQVL